MVVSLRVHPKTPESHRRDAGATRVLGCTVSCFLPFVLASGAAAETIVLAQAGRPMATIVLPADAPANLADAAGDLQRYVNKICGVELPILRDGKSVAGTGLYIGRCEPSQDRDVPEESLNPETYAIRVRGGNLFFTGRYPTPTCFAVYSFIENALGVRWFAPGEAWEYVPKGVPGKLAVQQGAVVKVPDTSPRNWSGHAWFDSWKRWNLRNKTVEGEVVPRRSFQNFLHHVFAPSKYAKTHPEYYPLINGERWIPPEGFSHWRPCESNPEVIRLTVEYARKFFDERPTVDSFSLGMDDVVYLCGCKECRALDASSDSYKKREFSDRHYKFVNAVAREIARTHPQRYIGTLIYDIVRNPPKTVERLEDNVFGYLTEVSALWWEPGRREADHALTREWARRCKHLSRYDYYGMGTFTPRVYPHTVAEQVKFDKSCGLEGMYTEVYTFLPHTGPMIWAFAKLQWDASLGIDVLLNEFYTKMFGRAGQTMSRYFDVLERSWNTPRPGRRGWVHRNIINQALAISPEAVDEGMKLLAEAASQADDDLIRQRIDTIRAALQYAAYAIRTYAASAELIKTPIADASQAEQMLNQASKIVELRAERGPFYAAAMKREDLLGENLRGLAGFGYLLAGEVPNLERGSGIGAIRALEWYAEHAPEQLSKAATRLTESPRQAQSALGDLLRAWLWMRETHPPNLVKNPGFEDDGQKQTPQGQDQKIEAVPSEWSTWASRPVVQFSTRKGYGRNGSFAASIIGNGESAAYLQSFTVQPGQRYLCIGSARSSPAGQDASGVIGIRFQKPDGSWHPREDLEPRAHMVEQSDWQPLILLATVPQEAGRLVLLLSADHQPEKAAILFDDLQLYQLPQDW